MVLDSLKNGEACHHFGKLNVGVQCGPFSKLETHPELPAGHGFFEHAFVVLEFERGFAAIGCECDGLRTDFGLCGRIANVETRCAYRDRLAIAWIGGTGVNVRFDREKYVGCGGLSSERNGTKSHWAFLKCCRACWKHHLVECWQCGRQGEFKRIDWNRHWSARAGVQGEGGDGQQHGLQDCARESVHAFTIRVCSSIGCDFGPFRFMQPASGSFRNDSGRFEQRLPLTRASLWSDLTR
jgi:hypothetical protein